MPNVTEEFLDLQGLQDYDYAIKNYINTGLDDKADESDIQTLESEISDKADSSDLQNLESDMYDALATKADASALDDYLPITGGSYDESMSISTSGDITVESDGDVTIKGDDNASIGSGYSSISFQSAAASGTSVLINAEEGAIHIDSDHRVIIEGVQHPNENNAIHIYAQGNTIDIDGGTIRLLSDYGIYGSHDNHNAIKVLLSDIIGNEEDVTSYGAVAQNPYSVGELFCGNDTRIYRATQSISMGDTLDLNTNYEYVGTIVDLTDTKVDKVSGKGLSTEDYTTAEKTKLAGIATGAQVNTIESISVNGSAIYPDGNKNVNINLQNVGSYDVMPSNADLLAMDNNTIFHTEGFYSKADGNGGYYKVTTTYTYGALTIKTDSPKKFLVALGENGQENPAVIDVCRYGVRPLPYNTEINFNTITTANTYATENTNIIKNIYQPVYGSTYRFPVGRFVFEEGINISSTQSGICGSTLPHSRVSNYINANYIGGTTLYFPFLNNGDTAITVSFGNVENLAIVGNFNTYNFEIDRTKTISAPNEVVTEVIKEVDGTQVKCIGLNKTQAGFIHNVVTMGFYTGIKTPTANIYIDNIYAQKCHLGFDLLGDTKCTNLFGWNVHTLLSIGGSLTSAVNVRVDSCVHALNLIHGNGITINDIDGDYCTKSLIVIGSPDEWKEVKNCSITGVRGRCCTLKSYDSSQATSPDVRTLADTDGYGVVRLYRGAFIGNKIDFTNITSSNPFDASSDYRTPNIVFTFNSTYSMSATNNFFTTGFGDISSVDDMKKRFQTSNNNMSLRFDNATNVYQINNNDIYNLTDIIGMVINALPQAESEEV